MISEYHLHLNYNKQYKYNPVWYCIKLIKSNPLDVFGIACTTNLQQDAK